MNISVTKNLITTNKIFLFFIIIDALFFPYVRSVSASIGMIILPLWYLFNSSKIRLCSELKLSYLMFIIIIISFFISLTSNDSETIIRSSFTNNVMLIYGLLYYFFYKTYYLSVQKINIKPVLNIYIFFGFTLALIYFLDASSYFYLRNFWTMNGNVIEVTDTLSIFRFTSTFSDPNNASVVFVSVLSYLLFNSKTKFFHSVFLIFMTLVILVAAMSSTGFLLFGITLFMYFLRLSIDFFNNMNNMKRINIFITIFSFILLPFISMLLVNIFLDSSVFNTSLERVTNNSSESRVVMWEYLISQENIFKYLIIGMGGAVNLNGLLYLPHNGHLHMIYSYGLIVYLIFMYIFFRKRKKITIFSYLFILIILVGFTVNVGIYEYRFITLLSLLVASTNYHDVYEKSNNLKKYKNQNKLNEDIKK